MDTPTGWKREVSGLVVPANYEDLQVVRYRRRRLNEDGNFSLGTFLGTLGFDDPDGTEN